MKLGRLIQAVLIVAAVSLFAATASASAITWDTNGVDTGFLPSAGWTVVSEGGFTDNEIEYIVSSVTEVTLTYTPNTSSMNTPFSIVDFGDFLLACPACTAGSGTPSFTAPAFTGELEIDDLTDGATGFFDFSSTGGLVSGNSSAIQINWTPLQIGPDGNNANTGDFGFTYFAIPANTPVPAPNSGTPPGDVTVQGTINTTIAPEPATMAMVGGLFVGLAALARKRRRQ